jgi:hypothetical protein
LIKKSKENSEINFCKEIENKKIYQLEGSLLQNNGFNKFWLEKMKWKHAIHSMEIQVGMM